MSLQIAVIGSGAAGLAAARVLSRAGLEPLVLEQESAPGGIWRYTQDDNVSHRPMYRNLRTNLPKELMAYREFPWPSSIPASFVKHTDVQDYLDAYRTTFGLDRCIRYHCRVTNLEILLRQDDTSALSSDWPKIRLDWSDNNNNQDCSQTFDAVLVCNGHYAVPSIPDIPGLDDYLSANPTTTMLHSMAYDTPDPFANQVLLCVGGRASGSDLAREIGTVAQHVYVSDPSHGSLEPETNDNNITCLGRTERVCADGSVVFDGGARVEGIDVILFCTGYDYEFEFVKTEDLGFVRGERRVQPLLEQLWHAKYPNLAFVGLPHSVVPFPCFELQAEATLNQWINGWSLGDETERLEAAEKDAQGGGPKENGRVPQDTHYLGDYQWDYCRRLAKYAGLYDDAMEDYLQTNEVSTKPGQAAFKDCLSHHPFQAIYNDAGKARKAEKPGSDNYRNLVYVRNDAERTFSRSTLDATVGAAK